MSFLPIVDRELRVTARRSRTYWSRLVVALIAIVIGAVLLGAYSLTPQAQVGKTLFWALAGLSFSHCLFAGRMATADSISEEKREGTLGLLFLTDLKGYDIVLGKVVATSLNSFYGLLAIFPVLALTLLLGGMTNGEFARMIVVLVTTFLLSLAIGICSSALSRDARRAYGGNLLLTLVIMALLPWLAGAFLVGSLWENLEPEHFLASPVFGFFCAADKQYALNPEYFWWSIGIAQGWTWLLLFVASWAVPRNWQDKPSLPRGVQRSWREFWRALSYGRADKQKFFRKRLLDVNGFYWLTARARLKPLHVWSLIVGAVVWWLVGWFLNDGGVWLDPATGIAMAVVLNSAIKLWITLEAGQQISEDRRAGAMELLLSTPLTVKDILKGQFLALRRQFLWPLLVIIAIEVGFMVISLRNYYEPQTLFLWLVGIFMLLADIVALVFTSMAVALTAKNQQQMIITTVFRILVLPWLAFWIICVLANLWVALGSDRHEGLPWQFNLGLWFGLGLIADLIFGIHSALLLLTRFRQLATERFDASGARRRWRWLSWKSRSEAAVVEALAIAGQPAVRPPSSKRRRRWAIALASAITMLAIGSAYVYQQLYPPPPEPIVIRLEAGDSITNLRVFPGMVGVFFILPDGSLWRWGQAGGPKFAKAAVPEQVGTNNNWIEAHATFTSCYGLQSDGSLWSWGDQTDRSFSTEPVQIGSDRDWATIAPGNAHHAAIKRDGTLWMWGNNRWGQVDAGQAQFLPDPVQVGTGGKWRSVKCWASCTVGLQTDGSLWVWGQIPYLTKTGARGTNAIASTMVCRETNWVALARQSRTSARNRAGEWWSLFHDYPDPGVAAATNCLLLSAQAKSDQLVLGISIKPVLAQALYEVRGDGTLWMSPIAMTFPQTTNPSENWQRFDDRSDWTAVWSDGGTMLGLTTDGTLWTWGVDLTAEPRGTLKARLDRLESMLTDMFGQMPRRGANFGGPPLQIEPRPLMKFVKEK